MTSDSRFTRMLEPLLNFCEGMMGKGEPMDHTRTPLELAKGVVAEWRKIKDSPGKPEIMHIYRPELEAIGRLVAWAECQKAMDSAYDSGKNSDERDAVLRPRGWDGRTSRMKFVRGLRDAVMLGPQGREGK